MPISPDCDYGKHRACHGDAWDTVTDSLTRCDCECHGKPAEIMPANIPAEDVFGVTHHPTVEQAVGLAASLIETTVEAEQTIRRLQNIIGQDEEG